MGYYPEWTTQVPARDLPWNDDTPNWWCDECDFVERNSSKGPTEEREIHIGRWFVKWRYYLKCPDCGAKHYDY